MLGDQCRHVYPNTLIDLESEGSAVIRLSKADVLKASVVLRLNECLRIERSYNQE